MPYICVSVSKTLEASEKDQIKSELGSLITLVPGKTEEVTMVRIEDGCTLYKGGEALCNGAFIEVRLYGAAPRSDKEKFTEAVFLSLEKLLGTQACDIYLNIFEMESWGTKGKLK